MLLPVALLAGAGLFVSRNPNSIPFAHDNGPLRLVIERAEVVPITPREVFEGYDTKIEIVGRVAGRTLKPAGIPPRNTAINSNSANERLSVRSNGKFKTLRILKQKQDYSQISGSDWDVFSTTILLKLAHVPVTAQELFFEADARIDRWFDHRTLRRSPDERAAAPVEILLRQAGKKILVPKPSQYCPLKIENIEIIPLSKFIPSCGEDTLVLIHMSNTENPEKPYFKLARNSAYIEDRHGKRYRRFLYNAFPARRYWNDIENSLMLKAAGGAAVRFPLPLRQIPAAAGRLTFHADIYVNDCWPRHASVVVRDK